MKINLKKILPASVMDMGCLTAAFGIYLIVQQLFLMPCFALRLSEDDFAFVILFVTGFNIAGSVLGEECGNTLLIKATSYKKSGMSAVGDVSKILFSGGGILFFLFLAVKVFFSCSWLLWTACAGVTLLCAGRFYIAACYRLRQEFTYVLYMNIIYATGLLFGVLGFIFFHIHWIIVFIAGEAAVQLFAVIDKFRRSVEFIRVRGGRSEKFAETVNSYLKLAVIAAVLLTAGNFERFILFNHLDALSLNVFYAVSVCSKMILFIGNPLYSYLLAKFSGCDKSDQNALLKKTLKYTSAAVPFIIVGAWVFSYIGLRLLYPDYLAAGKELLLPLALVSGLGFAGTVFRPLVMRFSSQTLLMFNTLIYGSVLWGSTVFGCHVAHLQGAVWALVFSQIIFVAGLFFIAVLKSGKSADITKVL